MEKWLREVVNLGARWGHGSYSGAESRCQMGPWHGVQPGETRTAWSGRSQTQAHAPVGTDNEPTGQVLVSDVGESQGRSPATLARGSWKW